jgi:hypothetical protein
MWHFWILYLHFGGVVAFCSYNVVSMLVNCAFDIVKYKGKMAVSTEKIGSIFILRWNVECRMKENV